MKTEELKKIVETLKPAFKLNDIAEFGRYIMFIDNKAFVYNGSNAIVVDYKSDVEFAVPADEFTKFISKIKSKEVSITFDENIEIKAGNAKASFALNSEILKSAKDLKIKVPTEFEKLPDDFIKAISLCQYSIGKDKSYQNLTFLHIEGRNVASTDNFRVSEYIMDTEMKDMMISGDVLKYLITFKVNQYSLDKGICYFKNDDSTVFITRISELAFPDYVDYLDGDGQEIEFPENIIDMVETASVTVDGIVDVDKNIKIDIENSFIKISSENEIGRIEVEEKINYDEDISVSINPMFLNQILKLTKNVIVCENRLLFEIDNFRHVVALLN